MGDSSRAAGISPLSSLSFQPFPAFLPLSACFSCLLSFAHFVIFPHPHPRLLSYLFCSSPLSRISFWPSVGLAVPGYAFLAGNDIGVMMVQYCGPIRSVVTRRDQCRRRKVFLGGSFGLEIAVMRLVEAVIFLLLVRVPHGVCEDDTPCLQQVKDSVTDTSGFFYNWNFTNLSAKAYLCNFNGVTCWNQQENKVFALKLTDGGLSGPFPNGLKDCQSLQSLDLSQNSFTGTIPADICTQLPYLASLDLSANNFLGPIPDDLGSCKYLNSLHLDSNDLSGAIPWEIGILPRLTDLDLSSNFLDGQIPSSLNNTPATAFQGNTRLCGFPLKTLCSPDKHVGSRILVPIAGFGVFAIILVGTIWWVFCRARKGGDI